MLLLKNKNTITNYTILFNYTAQGYSGYDNWITEYIIPKDDSAKRFNSPSLSEALEYSKKSLALYTDEVNDPNDDTQYPGAGNYLDMAEVHIFLGEYDLAYFNLDYGYKQYKANQWLSYLKQWIDTRDWSTSGFDQLDSRYINFLEQLEEELILSTE